MIRHLVLAGAAVVGAVVGAATTATVQDAGGDATTAAAAAPTTPTATVPTPAATEQLLLAWTSGELPAGLAATAATVPGVSTVVVIDGGPLELRAATDADGRTTPVGPDGWVVDVDAVSVDPAAAGRIVSAADRPAITGLRPGQAVLSETSAALRGVGVGATLHLQDGSDLTVTGVVSDDAIGGAELATTGLDVGPSRALVVVHEGDRGAVEAALTTPGTPIRFRAPGETPFLRAGDAVLPPAAIKATFGEFPHPAGGVDPDPQWVAANIATEDVPALGQVTCNRAILPALRSAMTELSQKNVGPAVVSYDGCFVPKRNGAELSRHTWGVAIDINYGEVQDPRLVEIMERWGFAWGGRWLSPDPAHFEYVRPVVA